MQAIDRFLDTLSAEAANLALRYLARGGVYIAGGGICAKLLERIQDGRVAQAYLDRGDASEIVAACPLYVSDAEDLGLAGVKAAARAWVEPRTVKVKRRYSIDCTSLEPAWLAAYADGSRRAPLRSPLLPP